MYVGKDFHWRDFDHYGWFSKSYYWYRWVKKLFTCLGWFLSHQIWVTLVKGAPRVHHLSFIGWHHPVPWHPFRWLIRTCGATLFHATRSSLSFSGWRHPVPCRRLVFYLVWWHHPVPCHPFRWLVRTCGATLRLSPSFCIIIIIIK